MPPGVRQETNESQEQAHDEVPHQDGRHQRGRCSRNRRLERHGRIADHGPPDQGRRGPHARPVAGREGQAGPGDRLEGRTERQGRRGRRNGVNGSNGADGATGANGSNGKDGVDGIDGRNGVDGQQGIPGLPGAPGAPGLDGKPGEDGQPGKPGKDGVRYDRIVGDCSSNAIDGEITVYDGEAHLGVPTQLSWAQIRSYPESVRMYDVDELSFKAHASDEGQTYMKVRTTGHNTITFSPNTQPDGETLSKMVEYDVLKGTARWNDDTGNEPDFSWEQILEKSGNERIKSISLIAGCARVTAARRSSTTSRSTARCSTSASPASLSARPHGTCWRGVALSGSARATEEQRQGQSPPRLAFSRSATPARTVEPRGPWEARSGLAQTGHRRIDPAQR